MKIRTIEQEKTIDFVCDLATSRGHIVDVTTYSNGSAAIRCHACDAVAYAFKSGNNSDGFQGPHCEGHA